MSNKKRDIVDEIKSIRSRRMSDFATAELHLRLLPLEMSYASRDVSDKELLRYFPIAIVGCMESYFRLVVKQLVDSGEPYLSNARELMQSSNLKFDVIKALHGKSLTIGDIISHSISISRLEHISSIMDTILSRKFLGDVATIHDRWEVEIKHKEAIPILSEPEETYRYVSKAFELRHIFCHELSTVYEVESNEINLSFEHSVKFLNASEKYISSILFPNAPLTQSEMNNDSSRSYLEERKGLDEDLYNFSLSIGLEEKAKLDEATEAWDGYVSAIVEFEGLPYREGGSMWPTIENTTRTNLTREYRDHIKYLKNIGEF